jgi:hypothetical protein
MTGACVINLQALRIDFAKACTSYDYSLHTVRAWCSDTAEEATKTFSLFPYHKVCSNSHRGSSGLYERTRGEHANRQTTIWSIHIVSCEKCKLNPCLKTDILLLLPLALQPIVGFGLSKNAPQFFPIYRQLSPSSQSHHLNITFYFFSPSFPGQNRQYFFQKQFISIKC